MFAVASPSSRRAWIEILAMAPFTAYLRGRPPRGGRGLKYIPPVLFDDWDASPSSRRAWIEIFCAAPPHYYLRSPSSRRAWIEISNIYFSVPNVLRRPPRGGRGLK